MLDIKIQPEEHKFYFFFFLALTFLFAMLMPFSYGDFAVWIAEGRQIVEQQTAYIRDVYSFNPTQALPYPWLSCLFYYFLESNFGIDFVFFLHRIIPVAIVAYWLVRYPALMDKQSLITLMICISGIRMLIIDRPALLVLPLIPYIYELIESDKIYKRKVKSLLLLILWVNLHGSFMLFLMLLGYKNFIDFLKNRESITKEKILFFILAILTTLINPWGARIYNYVYQTAAISKARITEWQPLGLYDNGELSFEFLFFSATIILLTGITIYKKKFLLLLRSLLPLFIISSAVAIRNLPLFFSVLPLFWGKNLVDKYRIDDYIKKAGSAKIMFNRAIVILLIMAGLFVFTSNGETFRNKLSPKYQSKYDETSTFKIAEYLSQYSEKRVFNSWLLGSFLMYAQKNKIFIDTRNIIYNESIYKDYVRAVSNYDGQAEALLNKYQIDFVVTEKIQNLTQALQTSQNWTFIMEDNGYALFKRK